MLLREPALAKCVCGHRQSNTCASESKKPEDGAHSPALSAAAQKKYQQQNTERHTHQPENDVADLTFLILQISHLKFLPLSAASN